MWAVLVNTLAHDERRGKPVSKKHAQEPFEKPDRYPAEAPGTVHQRALAEFFKKFCGVARGLTRAALSAPA